LAGEKRSRGGWKRDGEMAPRGRLLRVFFSKKGSSGPWRRRKMVKGFFFGFLCGLGFSPLIFQNCPLLCVLWRLVFIDKNIARFPNLIPQLLFFL
jgi:hypothetical protein